jgi:SAM-dependent methyltransferase
LNRAFYDSVWKHGRLSKPDGFNTWPVVREVAGRGGRLLEIGPGLRPRLPLGEAEFIDLSREAVEQLRAHGARALVGSATCLPFADERFNFVCALDVLEHLGSQENVFREVARVLRPRGRLLFAIPLHSAEWTAFDNLVGHSIRYDGARLARLLHENGLRVDRTAPFGILPRNRMLLEIGTQVLSRFRGPASWLEDRLVLPLSRLFKRRLKWSPGLQLPSRATGLILLCTKDQKD